MKDLLELLTKNVRKEKKMFNRDVLNFQVEKFPLEFVNETPEHVLYNEEMRPDIGMGLRRKIQKN